MLLVTSASAPLGDPLVHRGLTRWPWKITQQQKSWIGEVADPRCFECVLAAECWIGVGFRVDPCILRLDREQSAWKEE